MVILIYQNASESSIWSAVHDEMHVWNLLSAPYTNYVQNNEMYSVSLLRHLVRAERYQRAFQCGIGAPKINSIASCFCCVGGPHVKRFLRHRLSQALVNFSHAIAVRLFDNSHLFNHIWVFRYLLMIYVVSTNFMVLTELSFDSNWW